MSSKMHEENGCGLDLDSLQLASLVWFIIVGKSGLIEESEHLGRIYLPRVAPWCKVQTIKPPDKNMCAKSISVKGAHPIACESLGRV